jgi:hypothetical protein
MESREHPLRDTVPLFPSLAIGAILAGKTCVAIRIGVWTLLLSRRF